MFSGSRSVIVLKIPGLPEKSLLTIGCLYISYSACCPLLSLSHSSLTPFGLQRKHMTSPNIRYIQTTLGNLRFAAPILPLGRNLIIQDGSVGTICPQAIPAWQPIGLEFTAAWAADRLPFNYTAAVVS